MRPTILRECADSENKSVHLFVEWPRVIRDRDAHIMSASSLDHVPLCIGPPDCNSLRRCGISTSFLDGFTGMNSNFAPALERLHACSFVCLDRRLAAANIRPVVCSEPANWQIVDEDVRFLSQIKNCDRTARSSQ